MAILGTPSPKQPRRNFSTAWGLPASETLTLRRPVRSPAEEHWPPPASSWYVSCQQAVQAGALQSRMPKNPLWPPQSPQSVARKQPAHLAPAHGCRDVLQPIGQAMAVLTLSAWTHGFTPSDAEQTWLPLCSCKHQVTHLCASTTLQGSSL